MSTDTRVSDAEFSLDTGNFADVISIADELTNKMSELKNQLDNLKENLMFSWSGKGRNTFEKKYRLLSQQFGDLRDDLRDITEALKEREQAYIQADIDIAKTLDGKDSRY